MLGGQTLFEFPSSEFVKPYKQKVTMMFAYVNLLGAVGMIIGEQLMILPLMAVHLLQTFIKNNPFNVEAKAAQQKYENNHRAFVFDLIILIGLFVAII